MKEKALAKQGEIPMQKEENDNNHSGIFLLMGQI